MIADAILARSRVVRKDRAAAVNTKRACGAASDVGADAVSKDGTRQQPCGECDDQQRSNQPAERPEVAGRKVIVVLP